MSWSNSGLLGVGGIGEVERGHPMVNPDEDTSTSVKRRTLKSKRAVTEDKVMSISLPRKSLLFARIPEILIHSC